MPNESTENVIDSQNTDNEVVETETETEVEVEEETTVEAKPKKRTPQEELAYFEGRAKRLRKDLGLDTDEPKPKKERTTNDLGEKAFLIANGIKGADELELFQRIKKETGKDTETLLDSTYFQTELTAFRQQKATDNAIPSRSKRSNNSTVDSVEYWLAKGELPPASEVELRRKVVNARIKKEETQGVFYNS